MKIEAGKYYRTQDGRKVGPMSKSKFGSEVGKCESWEWHGRDGIYWNALLNSEKVHPLNLVSEWVEGPQVGTLKEIGAKPGDVVKVVGLVGQGECVTTGVGWIIKKVENSEYFGVRPTYKLEHPGVRLSHDHHLWKIVCRVEEPKGPIQTVTKKKIVPGVYDNLSINEDIGIHVGWTYGVDQIKELIKTLQSVVEVLEEENKNACP